MHRSTRVRRGLRCALPIAAAFALAVPHMAAAAPIDGFAIGDGPILEINSILLAYDENSDSLFAVDLGGDATFQDEGTTLSIDGTGLTIILSIDGTGLLQAGSFELNGVIDELGFDSGTLVTGEAVKFGFFPGGGDESLGPAIDELQIVFAITGGDAAELFDGRLAVRLTGTGFPGGWSLDWVNDGEGFTVAGNVPIPGALLLMLTSLAGLGFYRRRGTAAGG